MYLDSWIDERSLDCCFQLIETESLSPFQEWIAEWSDLVAFEIVPVVASAEAAARLRETMPADHTTLPDTESSTG